MLTIQQLNDKIAAEAQQFQEYKTAKEGELATKDGTINELNLQIQDKDARIADLESQVANAGIPDETGTAVENIVQP